MRTKFTGLTVLTVTLLLVQQSRADVSIEIDAGLLRNATGTAFVPVGGLLQLIATPSGSAANFVNPTAGSFVGGDNIIVASFSMNNNVQPGETDNTISFKLQNTGTATATTFDQGDPLLLRWYPTLTTASTAPTTGTTYGQYRSNTGEVGGIAWFAPADGTNLFAPNGLNFNTTGAGGSNPETTGYASLLVGAIPEPSTYALLGLGLGGLTFGAMQRRRRQVAH